MLLEIHVMIIDNKPTTKLINKSIEKSLLFFERECVCTRAFICFFAEDVCCERPPQVPYRLE